MCLFRWSLGKNGGQVKRRCLEWQELAPYGRQEACTNRKHLAKHHSMLLQGPWPLGEGGFPNGGGRRG
jgi:hypothetical protein